MTKKGHQKFWRMKSENFIGKGNLESEFFSQTWGNLKEGEMHHCLRGDGRPWVHVGPI